MVLDAFDSKTIKTGEEIEDEEEDQLSKQLNKLKSTVTKKIKSFKLWLKMKFIHKGLPYRHSKLTFSLEKIQVSSSTLEL